jgi:hypothetical protein
MPDIINYYIFKFRCDTWRPSSCQHINRHPGLWRHLVLWVHVLKILTTFSSRPLVTPSPHNPDDLDHISPKIHFRRSWRSIVSEDRLMRPCTSVRPFYCRAFSQKIGNPRDHGRTVDTGRRNDRKRCHCLNALLQQLLGITLLQKMTLYTTVSLIIPFE